MHSNFLTPPDHVEDRSLHTILLIDATDDEVKEVAELCQVVGTDFNIYLYHHGMEDLPWLEKAFNLSGTVLINSIPTTISVIKDRLVGHPKAFNYGPKNFFDNHRKIVSPVQYLITYVQRQSNSSL